MKSFWNSVQRFLRHVRGTDRVFIRCPFHHEQTGSCIVDHWKGIYYCLGCGRKGCITEIPEGRRG